MIKQITKQLELPLEHIYQMALVGMKAAHTAKKFVPCVPAMIQLCLNFSEKKATSWKEKLKLVAYGVAAGATTVIGTLGLGAIIG